MPICAAYQSHIHYWSNAVNRGTHISSSSDRLTMSKRIYSIVLTSTSAQIINLKVSISLSETKQIEIVMHVTIEIKDIEDFLFVPFCVLRIENDNITLLCTLTWREWRIAEVSVDTVSNREVLFYPIVRKFCW